MPFYLLHSAVRGAPMYTLLECVESARKNSHPVSLPGLYPHSLTNVDLSFRIPCQQ